MHQLIWNSGDADMIMRMCSSYCYYCAVRKPESARFVTKLFWILVCVVCRLMTLLMRVA